VVFNEKHPNSFLQVIFRGTYWARSWAILSKEEEMKNLKKACHILEVIGMEIFNNFRWKIRSRLQA
jgi:hypothetical protein